METDIKQIQKKLQQICSRQEKCSADILDYLIKHKVSQEFHQSVLNSLIAEKFIDEERYARAVVQDKFRLNRWGRVKIRYFLISKRIPDESIGKALGMIDEDEYRQILEWELKKKAKILTKEDPEMKKMKLLQFAASKGFEEEIVWKVLKSSASLPE
jgi:regulatory protein